MAPREPFESCYLGWEVKRDQPQRAWGAFQHVCCALSGKTWALLAGRHVAESLPVYTSVSMTKAAGEIQQHWGSALEEVTDQGVDHCALRASGQPWVPVGTGSSTTGYSKNLFVFSLLEPRVESGGRLGQPCRFPLNSARRMKTASTDHFSSKTRDFPEGSKVLGIFLLPLFSSLCPKPQMPHLKWSFSDGQDVP